MRMAITIFVFGIFSLIIFKGMCDFRDSDENLKSEESSLKKYLLSYFNRLHALHNKNMGNTDASHNKDIE